MPTWEGIAGRAFFKEVFYVEIPEPEERIYHELNGEIIVNKLAEEEREIIAEFRTPGNQFGHWLCTVYSTGGQYFLEMRWIPREGFAWEEVVVYRLKTI